MAEVGFPIGDYVAVFFEGGVGEGTPFPGFGLAVGALAVVEAGEVTDFEEGEGVWGVRLEGGIEALAEALVEVVVVGVGGNFDAVEEFGPGCTEGFELGVGFTGGVEDFAVEGGAEHTEEVSESDEVHGRCTSGVRDDARGWAVWGLVLRERNEVLCGFGGGSG